MFLVLALMAFGCGESSDDDGESRNVGGTDAGISSDMGSGDRGRGTSTGGQTCADGVPVATASDWRTFLPKPATAVEAVWTGEHFGLLWLASEASNGVRPLKFVRASTDGTLLGDIVTVGQAATASHKLVWTDERFIVAWVNGRAGEDTYDGIRVTVISPEGALADTSNDVVGTFSTVQLDLDWNSFAGGLLTYTKGSLGEGGLFVTTVNSDGSLNTEMTVDERQTSAFATVYGDGAWAVAYAIRDAEQDDPIVLHLLDEEGTVYDPTPVELSTKALGRVQIAFSRGNYAIAWTGMNAEDKVQPATVLLDGAAEIIGQPVVAIPAEFGILEDLVAVTSQGFVLSWHGEIEARPVLAVQVMSALGILEEPIVLEHEAAAQFSQSRLVVGAEEAVHLFCTVDSQPQPLGYSADVEVSGILLETCE